MAGRSLGVLTVDLVMRLGGFKQGADQATRQFDKMSKDINKTASNLGRNLAGIGSTLLGGLGIASVIQATSEAEKALAKLNAAVIANGGAAGRSTAQLEAYSSELQNISIFADDAIQSAQSLLLRFDSIRGDNFDRATKSVLDLSSALDKDLSTVALSLGRALEQPDTGLKKLARSGVIFSQAQQDIVNRLVETGEKAKAQSFILDELEQKFGGASEAARDNFGGALTGLKNAFGDLLEAKGGLPETVDKIEELTKLLASDEAKQSANTFSSAIVNGIGAIAAAIGPVLILISKLINAAGDAGARIDKYLFGRQFDDSTEKRLFGLTTQIDELLRRRGELAAAKSRGGILDSLGLTDASIEQVEQEIARLQAMQSSGPKSRARVRGTSDVKVIGDEEAEAAAKLYDETRTAAEKYKEEVAELDRLLQKKAIDQDVYNRKLAALRADLNKGSGSNKVANEVEAASKKIEGSIEALQAQVDTLGLGEAATLRYSATQGELAKSFDLLGAAADPLREKLLGLSSELETKKATAAVEEQIQALYEQTATLGLTEEEALRYSIAQGEIAKQLALTGEASDDLKARLDAANAGLAEARRQLELEAEGKSIFEATRTDAEKYEQTLKDLGENLAAETVSQETYNRAVADAVIQYKSGDSAAKAYAAQIEELNRLLAEGTIGQEAYEAAIAKAEEVFAEAGKKAAEVFVDQAKRNTQDILADFLTDPFSKGIDGLIQDFDEMFRKIAAQAIAAKIADKLFAGFDDWIDKAIASFSKLGSSGSGLGGVVSGLAGLFGGGGGGSIGVINGFDFASIGLSEGGHTGMGGKHEPMGIVHGNEYVMPMERVQEPGALAFLEAFHKKGMRTLRGYATGGFVSPSIASAAMASAAGSVGPGMPEAMQVSQSFMINAPNGTVSKQTQQQIAAAAAKGLASANRRNN